MRQLIQTLVGDEAADEWYSTYMAKMMADNLHSRSI